MNLQPKFEERGPFTVVGIKATSNMKAMEIENPFPKLWADFIPRVPEIKNIADLPQYGNLALGLCWCDCQGECTCGPESDFHIMATFVVDQATDTPAGMEVIEIPKLEYAVFEYKGKLEDLGEFYEYIYKTWMPQTERKLAGGYQLEWYDKRYEHGSDEAVIEILYPVLPKA